jgi:uncharacterized protein (TIGR02145 family)
MMLNRAFMRNVFQGAGVYILNILLFVSIAIDQSHGQSPEGFNYQAVARDMEGKVLQDTDVSFRISLLRHNMTGNAVYSEVHNTRTSDFGIVNLVIGKGSFVTSNFKAIDWSDQPLYLKVEMDAEGGTNYELMGITQLLSVPFAMYAEKSGDGITTTDQVISGEKTFTSPIRGNIRGGVVLNANSPSVAGALRWTGTDFQGFTGEKWISLTAGGGAVVEDDTTVWTCGDILVDPRDGNEYRTVLIGNQCWTQDNLRYDSGEGCFAGTGSYAPELAGRYYTWAGALDIDTQYDHEEYISKDTYIQGACPSGWHVASHQEYIEMESMDGMNGLALLEGGSSGFEARLAGDRLIDGTYSNSGVAAVFWTATQEDAENAWKRILFDGEEGIGVFIFEKGTGFSVRCIKD